MLVNIHHDAPREHARLFVAGIAFMTSIAMLIGLAIAIYNKTFDTVTWVTLKADRAGLQLAKYGDVRIHGVLIGQVRSIEQDGKEAVIKLALNPSAAKNIPDNVDVQIVPTTLFGQKFVSFVEPKTPSVHPLTSGTVIPASRVQTSVELQQILATLFPLLRSVRPADLNATLYAISHALIGNGTKIGQSMSDLNSYLIEFNPHLPTFSKDIALLAQVSGTYAASAPDLVRLLRNASVTARTVTSKQASLPSFIRDVTSLASTSTTFLGRNEANIVAAARYSAPIAQLLDTYHPEFPCLLKGLDHYTGYLAQIFRQDRIWQGLRMTNNPRKRAYDARDRPINGEVGHGPWCLGLPYPTVPAGYLPLKNGSHLDENPAHPQPGRG